LPYRGLPIIPEHQALFCQEAQLWENLCRLIGREDFISLQFADIERQKEMYDALSKTFAMKSRAEWMNLLDEADVAAAPVYDMKEAHLDTHFRHRNFPVELEHPKLGSVRLLTNPLRFSDTPVQPRTRPPLYAENTAEILHDLAEVTEQEIENLRLEGVIE
jgi:crotonobetainyl-CoA:carnitine CoA-transferase CaiB-like acyl-CoA transferase